MSRLLTQNKAKRGLFARLNKPISSTFNYKSFSIFIVPAAIFMFMFLLYPLITLFTDSFFDFDDTGKRFFIGFANYISVFKSKIFLKSFKNTFLYVVFAVGFEVIFGLTLAIVLNHKFKGFQGFRTLVLSPLMIAPLVAGLIWKFMLSSQFGIINHMLYKMGLIESMSSVLWLADSKLALASVIIADVWLTTPFMMLMFLAGIQGVPDTLYEAAVIEGANKLQIIFKIILPTIRPVLFSALVIRVIDAARSFDIIWVMTQGGPNNSSELLSVHIYKSLQRYGEIGYASAAAVLFIIVLIALTLIFMKNLKE